MKKTGEKITDQMCKAAAEILNMQTDLSWDWAREIRDGKYELSFRQKVAAIRALE